MIRPHAPYQMVAREDGMHHNGGVEQGHDWLKWGRSARIYITK